MMTITHINTYSQVAKAIAIPGLVYHGFILELLIIAPHQPPPPPPRGDIPAKSMLTSGSA